MKTNKADARKLTQAELFKESGIEQVLAGEEAWNDEVRGFVGRFAHGFQFTVDDVRPNIIVEPHHANCWGAAFNRLARAGLARRIGFRPSKTPSTHSRIVSIWERT